MQFIPFFFQISKEWNIFYGVPMLWFGVDVLNFITLNAIIYIFALICSFQSLQERGRLQGKPRVFRTFYTKRVFRFCIFQCIPCRKYLHLVPQTTWYLHINQKIRLNEASEATKGPEPPSQEPSKMLLWGIKMQRKPIWCWIGSFYPRYSWTITHCSTWHT